MAYQKPRKQATQQQAKADVEFAKGVSCRHLETKFGDIIKLGVNVEQFCENEINEQGFVNIEIKKSKKGEYFAVLVKPLEK